MKLNIRETTADLRVARKGLERGEEKKGKRKEREEGRKGGREVTYMLEGFLSLSFTDLSSILKSLTSRRYSAVEQMKGLGLMLGACFIASGFTLS